MTKKMEKILLDSIGSSLHQHLAQIYNEVGVFYKWLFAFEKQQVYVINASNSSLNICIQNNNT